MHPVALRLLKLLRGGRGARHVVPAVVLGALAGAVCGWNLTFAAVVTAALMINGPLGATLVAAAAAFIVTRCASHLMQSLGGFCLEKLGLGAIVESLGHGTTASLLAWDDYELVGGAVLALCAALPAAHALARRAGRTVTWSPTTDRLLRPYCVPVGAVCALLAILLPSMVGPRLVAHALLEQWSAVVGAPVTAEQISYDPSSGQLQLSQLRVHGLSEPGRVTLRVEHARLRVDPGLLLRGCLHCDEVLLSGIECDRPPATPTMPAAVEPTFLREDAPPGTRATAQPIDVARYVRDWNEIENRLALLGTLIGSVETVADLETQHAAASRLEAVRRRRTAPLDPLSGKTLPLVQIKSLKVEDLPEAWSLGADASLEFANLTSRTGQTVRTTQLTVDAPACRGRITVGFRFAGPDRRHDVTTSWDNGAAASIVDARRAAAAGIDTAYGQLTSLRGQGWITREALEVPLACEVRGIVPAANCGRFGDIDGAVWHAGITRLGGLRFELSLTGRLRHAKLQLTPSAMVVQLKHQLRAAGEHQLVKAVEAGRLTIDAPTPLVAAPLPTPTKNASPIAAVIDASKQPTAATVAAVAPATNPAPIAPAVGAPAVGTPTASAPIVGATAVRTTNSVAASTAASATSPPVAATPTPTSAPSIAAAVTAPPAIATSAAANRAAPPVSTPIPTPTPAAAPAVATAPAVPMSTHLATTPTPGTPAAANAPATNGASGRAAAQPSPTEGLRQPSSVATTSAAPSFAEWSSSYQPPRQSLTKPSVTPPHVATRPRTLTNLPQQPTQPAAPPVTRPVAPTAPQTAPQAKPESQIEQPKASLFSRVGGWLSSTDAEPAPESAPRAAPPTVTPQASQQPEQAVAESKPYFPRLRALFAEEPEVETMVVNPPEIDQPSPTPPPQTAVKPWYERAFR